MSVFTHKDTNDYWSLGWRTFHVPKPRWYFCAESASRSMPNAVTLGTPWKSIQVSFSYKSVTDYYVRVGKKT